MSNALQFIQQNPQLYQRFQRVTQPIRRTDFDSAIESREARREQSAERQALIDEIGIEGYQQLVGVNNARAAQIRDERNSGFGGFIKRAVPAVVAGGIGAGLFSGLTSALGAGAGGSGGGALSQPLTLPSQAVVGGAPGTAINAASGAGGGGGLFNLLGGAGGGTMSNFLNSPLGRVLGSVGGSTLLESLGPSALTDALGLTDRDAERALQGAQLRIPNFNLPGGGNISVGPNGINTNLGDMGALRRSLLARSLSAADSPQGLQDIATQRLGLLRELSAPHEERLLDSVQNRLQRSGRLGPQDTAAGRAFGEVTSQLSQTDLARQLASLDFASVEGDRQFNRALSGAQGVQGIDDQMLRSLSAALNVGIGRINSQLGIGSGLTNVTRNTTAPIDFVGGLFDVFQS